MSVLQPTLTQRLESALADADHADLEQLVAATSELDLVHALAQLRDPERVLRALPPAIAAELIDIFPAAYAADMLEDLVTAEAVEIVEAATGSQQADLLGSVDELTRSAILRELDPAAASSARRLLEHHPTSAGGLMLSDFLRFDGRAVPNDVLAAVTDPASALPRHVTRRAYVVDGNGLLLGAVRTRDLVGAIRNRALRHLAAPCTVLNAAAPLPLLHDIFAATDHLALPVTDDAGHLLGVVTREAIETAYANDLTEQHMRSQGILQEELRSMPVLQRSRRRLSWLTINIGLNILAASIIAAFESTLQAVIALAVFLPIVSDMSGCSGNQAVAVSMRELTLGVARPADVLRVWWQEAKVGVMNGLALGLLLGLAAFLWKGSPMLGAVVGVALAVNTLVAVSIGGTIPLLLKRFNVDPAVASGPVLTTVTDMCGFLLVLGLATIALPWL